MINAYIPSYTEPTFFSINDNLTIVLLYALTIILISELLRFYLSLKKKRE